MTNVVVSTYTPVAPIEDNPYNQYRVSDSHIINRFPTCIDIMKVTEWLKFRNNCDQYEVAMYVDVRRQGNDQVDKNGIIILFSWKRLCH